MFRTNLQEARGKLLGSPSASVLAKRARISRGQLSQIEIAAIRPGARARVNLAKALGLSLDDFDLLWLLDRRAWLEREKVRVDDTLAKRRLKRSA